MFIKNLTVGQSFSFKGDTYAYTVLAIKPGVSLTRVEVAYPGSDVQSVFVSPSLTTVTVL